MTRKGAAGGFTLVEMIIALALSMVVLVAIVTVSTNMIRMQFQDIRSGNVTNFTWIALDQMNRELENATHLELPGPALSDAGNVLSGCVNWSNRANPNGGAIDTTQAYYAFYYCVDSGNNLMRYQADNVCPFPAPGARQGTAAAAACGDPSFAAASNSSNIVVYQNFFADRAQYFFKKSSPVSGVEMHYVVGKAPTVVDPQAKQFVISTMVGMNKSYNNGSD